MRPRDAVHTFGLRRPRGAAGLAVAVVAAAVLSAVSVGSPAYAGTVPTGYDTATSTGAVGPSQGPGSAVTTTQILWRAADWLSRDVPYSQTAGWADDTVGGPYRTDCSGFVSMAWGLRNSLTTETLPSVSTQLGSWNDLQPGDALDYTADHVVLFVRWDDKSAGSFYYDAEHAPGQQPNQSLYNGGSTLEGYAVSDFIPLRYDNLQEMDDQAVYNPDDGLNVFATSSAGAVEDMTWVSGTATWTKLGGGSITGSPAAAWDPGDGRMDVFADKGGHLEIDYWTSSSGWSGWNDLGGSVTGNPSPVWDPAKSQMEVYATASNGDLDLYDWSSGSGTFYDQGGNIVNSPDAFYDPGKSMLEIYATGANGHLELYDWSSGSGTWYDQGGDITGSPDAVYNTAKSAIQVYATAASGDLDLYDWSSGSGTFYDQGGNIVGSPSATFNTAKSQIQIYATGADGDLKLYDWSTGTGTWYDQGGDVTGNPCSMFDAAKSQIEIYATGVDGDLKLYDWSSGTGTFYDQGGNLSH